MKLCLIPGDGIGREVVPVAAAALQQLLPDVQLQHADAGWECFVRTGQALPEATLACARDAMPAFRCAIPPPILLGPLAAAAVHCRASCV